MYPSSVQKSRKTILHCLRRAFINPFSVILFFIGIVSLFTEIVFANNHRNVTPVMIIFVMLIVSGIIRLVQELRAKQIADRLTALISTSVETLKADRWIEVSSEELATGDRVRVNAGDRVPADLRIICARDLFVSQSIITGESAIVEKTDKAIENFSGKKVDNPNLLLCGTTVTGGYGEGIVIATGTDTVFGDLGSRETERKRGFDKGANSIARVLIKFMAILVPVVFLAGGLTKGDWVNAFIFALSVAVGLTPELLPMVVNACLAKGSFSMGQKQTVVKDINAMQGFGSMDVLCVDKTGTLTMDTVKLEYYTDILGNENLKSLEYAYLASYYHTGVNNHLDAAILKADEMPGKGEAFKNLVDRHKKLDEQPFDYGRKFTSVLLEDDSQKIAIIKGNIDSVAKRCSKVEYRNTIIDITDDSDIHSIVDEMLEDGMKVIAVAYKPVDSVSLDDELEAGFILIGYLVFFDAPKNTATSAVKKMRDLNLNVKILTGDNALVAESICSRIGIDSSYSMTGDEFEKLSENEILLAVEKTTVFSELSPKQKADIVGILQSNGHTVGFLGDGMNDLPAILQADVGISVENAAEAVKESADVILLKKDLNVLEEGVLEGRKAFANMTKYIKITASSNFGNICAIVIASVLLPFFPMTSVQLLLLNLLYDTLCLVLPWDKVDEELIVKPLEWTGKKLGGFMTFFGPLSSVFDLITFAFMFFVFCPLICGGSYGSLGVGQQALFVSLFQTGWFIESLWTQVLILQLLRTKKLPFIQSRPGTPVVIVTVVGIIAFTLLPLSTLGEAIGLCVLPFSYYAFLVFTVLVYLLTVTVAKGIYIRKKNELI